MAVWFVARFQVKRGQNKQFVNEDVKVGMLTMLATAVILSQGSQLYNFRIFFFIIFLFACFKKGRLNHIGGLITTWKPRIILAAWLLGLTVLIYAYSTTLISRLTAPEYKFLVNSIEDLKNNEEILPVTVKGAVLHEELAGSPSNALQAIEKRVKRNPDIMCLSVFDCFGTMLSKPNTVVIMVLI